MTWILQQDTNTDWITNWLKILKLLEKKAEPKLLQIFIKRTKDLETLYLVKYKDAYNSLTKIQSNKSVTDADLRKTYRLYNLSMTGNAMKFGDFDNLRTQNKKYFKYLKSKGYGGLIDTNDGVYGALQTKSPVMVFDMDSIIPKKTKQMKTGDKVFSSFVYLGKKLFE